jgi:hypothetical protein
MIRGGVSGVTTPVHNESYGLPGIDVCTSDLKVVEYGQARRVLETTSFGYRDV